MNRPNAETQCSSAGAEASNCECAQCQEERRHEGATSFTAVRTWRLLATVLPGLGNVARLRFIRIITSFKVLVWREATTPTRSHLKLVRSLIRSLRNNDLTGFDVIVSELEQSEAGRSVLVSYHNRIRAKEGRDRHPVVAGHDNPVLLKSVAHELRKSIQINQKRGGGVQGLAARDRVLKALIVWWDRYYDETNLGLTPARLHDNTFNSDFIDFLCVVNKGLLDHHLLTNKDCSPVARRLPARMRLGASRTSIIAALSKQRQREK